MSTNTPNYNLYMPDLGQKDPNIWGTDFNNNLVVIDLELNRLAQPIMITQLDQSTIDALTFGIAGKVDKYSDLPPASELSVGMLYVCENEEIIGAAVYPRGYYRVYDNGGVNAWEFYIGLDPVNMSYLDLIDGPNTYVGQNGKGLKVDEANNKFIYEDFVIDSTYQADLLSLTNSIQTNADSIVDNYFNLAISNSNLNLRNDLDSEIITRGNADGLLDGRATALEGTVSSHTGTLNNHEGRIQSLEDGDLPVDKNPIRWVVDSIVTADIIADAPSSNGYLIGQRVAVSDPSGGIKNGNIYVASPVDTWILEEERFQGLGVIVDNTQVIWIYNSDGQIGEYKSSLEVANDNFAVKKDYPLAWFIQKFITNAEAIAVPSLLVGVVDGEHYAVNDEGQATHGIVYRADLVADEWVLADSRVHGLGVYDLSSDVIYHFDGIDITNKWFSLSVDGALIYKGGWDASTGSFPAQVDPDLAVGWFYLVTVAGIVDGRDHQIGDAIYYNGGDKALAIGWDHIDNTEISHPADVMTVAEVTGLVAFHNHPNAQLDKLNAIGLPTFIGAKLTPQVATPLGTDTGVWFDNMGYLRSSHGFKLEDDQIVTFGNADNMSIGYSGGAGYIESPVLMIVDNKIAPNHSFQMTPGGISINSIGNSISINATGTGIVSNSGAINVQTVGDDRIMLYSGGILEFRDKYLTDFIELSELGVTGLDAWFDNTSIIGALNELAQEGGDNLLSSDNTWTGYITKFTGTYVDIYGQISFYDGVVKGEIFQYDEALGKMRLIGQSGSTLSIQSSNIEFLSNHMTGYLGLSETGVTELNAWFGSISILGALNELAQDKYEEINFVVDGGGAVIGASEKGDFTFGFNGEIVEATLLSKISGSIVIDLLKSTYAGFPAQASICAAQKPTLAAAQKSTDVTLTGWTKTFSAGDIVAVKVDSAATVERVTVSLRVKRV